MKVVVPWASKHFGSQNWTFQQDWAPAHGAKTTVELCREQFPDFWGKDIWPSNSPDLNPMDFAIWSILENKLSRTSYNNLDSHKVPLVKSWDEISQEELRPVVDTALSEPKSIETHNSSLGKLLIDINNLAADDSYSDEYESDISDKL
uniref:DDE_3 domain-containing protein n=1 Tax=Heterorhabditis bacteriophora TaxID=37862 RepID=A0A1I7WYV7_HETBA